MTLRPTTAKEIREVVEYVNAQIEGITRKVDETDNPVMVVSWSRLRDDLERLVKRMIEDLICAEIIELQAQQVQQGRD